MAPSTLLFLPPGYKTNYVLFFFFYQIRPGLLRTNQCCGRDSNLYSARVHSQAFLIHEPLLLCNIVLPEVFNPRHGVSKSPFSPRPSIRTVIRPDALSELLHRRHRALSEDNQWLSESSVRARRCVPAASSSVLCVSPGGDFTFRSQRHSKEPHPPPLFALQHALGSKREGGGCFYVSLCWKIKRAFEHFTSGIGRAMSSGNEIWFSWHFRIQHFMSEAPNPSSSSSARNIMQEERMWNHAGSHRRYERPLASDQLGSDSRGNRAWSGFNVIRLRFCRKGFCGWRILNKS